MKKTKILKIALSGALAFALFSCSNPASGLSNGGGSNSSGGNTSDTNDDPIYGNITETKTWPGKDEQGNSITYYIKKGSSLVLKESGTLNIEEGAIVKFGAGAKLTVSVGGTLNAHGVIFTSAKDPRGRTISSAGTDAPAPGDWLQIYVHGGHAELYNCEISYGGSGCHTVEVMKSGDTFPECKVEGCLFTNNDGTRSVGSSSVHAALYYSYNLNYDANYTVKNTTFKNNVWPLSIPAKFSISGTNHFGTGDEANEYNYILLNYYMVNSNATWEHQEVPYLYPKYSNYEMAIGSSSAAGALTIEGGTADDPTVVEFYQYGLHVNKNSGTLNVGEYVNFTNCQKTPNTKYTGLYLKKDSETWDEINASGNTIHPSESVFLLLSNPALHIEIDGFQAENKYYVNDSFNSHRCKTIQASNHN